ncbi:MAG: CHC2 zinc finger domain-containing protein, partial [Bacteroidaceae bacterium]|nr:CHC2 zinc finger domain-containing protein [Bacteroidaceae bacterium]
MLSKDEIQQLRSLPILNVAERLGLEVDSHRRCLCPFHDERTPSLVLYPSSNTFFCFACQHHGNVIDLAMKVFGKGFAETCNWLVNEHNVIIERNQYKSVQSVKSVFRPEKYLRYFEHPFLNKKSSEFLFSERHLNPRV